MADTINAADLVAETANTLDGSECLVGFDTTQGKKITVDQLAEYIIQKKLSSLASANQTVAAAISALNSKSTLVITNEQPQKTSSFNLNGSMVGNIIIISGYLQITDSINNGETIASCNKNFYKTIFTSAITSTGKWVRLKTNTSGDIQLDSAVDSTHGFISFEIVAIAG